MIDNILVVGGGSAGCIAAMTLKRMMPYLNVRVVRSTEMGVIGVGESTTGVVVDHLHGTLRLDPRSFYEQVRPIWKLGIHFLWGKRPWFDYAFGETFDFKYLGLQMFPGHYVTDDHYDDVGPVAAMMARKKAFRRGPNGLPVFHRSYAYHLENVRFVNWLESHCKSIGIELIDARVADVTVSEQGVSGVVLADGQVLTADLYVDCTGFRSMIVGGKLKEPFIPFTSTLYCDRAVVGGWKRGADERIEPYTTVETMNCGWCWRIDHEDIVNRGYVYSSSFISDDKAEQEFRTKNPRITDTRVVHFRTGRLERTWVKNVVAIGNASGFVEPLESTGVGMLCVASRHLAECLFESMTVPTPSMMKLYNSRIARKWDSIRRFLAVHYRFNNRLDNEFWRTCCEKVDLAGAEPIVECFQENGPCNAFNSELDSLDWMNADGYLSMMIGMNVPRQRRYEIPPQEQAVWNQIRAEHAALAENALTTEEALAIVHSPRWTWNPEQFLTDRFI